MNDSPGVSLSFRSDNVATVAPEIMRALEAANHGLAAAYGDDEYSALLNRKFSELFETGVTVFPVSTGTAANALSLATCARPYGAIYCHEDAHINTAEAGATEAFSGGAKLIALPGLNGKLEPQTVAAALQRADLGITNRSQPDAVSITQATEYGTVYRREDISAFASIAREAGIFFHMDGARFANALVALKCSPAEMTWRAGVDILSFGATKNGAMGAPTRSSCSTASSWSRCRIVCDEQGRPGRRCASPLRNSSPTLRTNCFCDSHRTRTSSPRSSVASWRRFRVCV